MVLGVIIVRFLFAITDLMVSCCDKFQINKQRNRLHDPKWRCYVDIMCCRGESIGRSCVVRIGA